MRILMLGDLVGKPGRDAAQSVLPTLRELHSPDLVVVNGENAAAGLGITPEISKSLFGCGVDVITLGNHSWSRRAIFDYLDREPRIVRPANYPEGTPGRGFTVVTSREGQKVAVANLQARTFMEALDHPFRTADAILNSVRSQTRITLFDFHGEATSEKIALGHYLDGRASAVVGTHTHVQTADETILPGGTAYITDIGMVGPQDSVLGMDKDIVVRRFLTQIPNRFEVAVGPVVLCGIVIDIDSATGRSQTIERIQIRDII